ncbi:glycosyltransferase family 2 protein [Chryseobacterium indoltheticum]|uniref:Glycosyltransferase n=1 Tax=Chryseobacterium indoltheticum TaxID=254 RepID=A0A3G6N442_9FLAO|nr:glycosyltransferase [Chryseobacterium indoltheticum]AZA62771.1 glycosyltransferase [Chryseobacterium indoltheticum]
MNNPRVSVITITYGHEKYIIDTIEGIVKQEYNGEIEYIISNDCSPDDTDEVITDYLTRINIPANITIKYTKQEKNIGIIPNFIWALKQATGKYISFCEGDDFWTDYQKLAKQISFLEANDSYVLSNTDCDAYYQNSGMLVKNINFLNRKKYRCINDLFTAKDILDANYIIRTASVVFKASFLNEYYNSDFFKVYADKLMMADTPLWTFLSTKGKFHYLNSSTMVYRVSESGVSNSTNEKKSLQFDISVCDMKYAMIFDNRYSFSKFLKYKNKLIYNHLNVNALIKKLDLYYLFPKELNSKNALLAKYASKSNLFKGFLEYKFRITLMFYNQLCKI